MNITTCLFTVLGGMATLGHPSETAPVNLYTDFLLFLWFPLQFPDSDSADEAHFYSNLR